MNQEPEKPAEKERNPETYRSHRREVWWQILFPMLAGVLFIGFFASEQYWHWFPTAGLSERAALDMTFLPHWSNWTDVLMLFALMALFVIGFSQLSIRLAQVPRTWLMSILGMVLGYSMAAVIPGESGTADGKAAGDGDLGSV